MEELNSLLPCEIPPETLQHLLSLPPLLQPLSPSLAALHLARVRLLLSIPASSTFNNLVGSWCHSCGGLWKGSSDGKQRIRATTDLCDVRAQRKRKRAECSQCGAKYQPPKPDKTTLSGFPPARTRSKRISASTSKLVPEVIIPTRSTSSLSPEPPATQKSSSIRSRPTLLSTPSLTYIPLSAPNPPTYPEPGRARFASPVLGGKVGGKKRKKSGLAKLLAENRQRAEREVGIGTGSWGLG